MHEVGVEEARDGLNAARMHHERWPGRVLRSSRTFTDLSRLVAVSDSGEASSLLCLWGWTAQLSSSINRIVLVRVDTQSSVPLFEQITAGLRRAIADGSVPAGDRLPPARELAAGLGVNMHTVLRAYQSLRDERLVSMHRGRGAIVVASRSEDRAALAELVEALAHRARALGFEPDEAAELVKGAMA